MAETLQFELVSPAQLVLSEPVEMAVVPGAEGDFGAMPQHAPLISAVRPGVIEIHVGGKIAHRIFVAGGFVEVTGERCTVLAEEAIPLAELTDERLAARAQGARKMADEAKDERAVAEAQKELAVAEAMKAALEKPAAH